MARFLVGTIAAIGHVNPALPIVRQLVAQGHEVWWYTGQGFKAKVEATGAHHVPIRRGIDITLPDSIPEEWAERRDALTGFAQFKFYLKYAFIDAAVTQLQDLSEILLEFPADVLLCDVFFLGMSWLHEQTGLPWAGFGMSALPFNSRDTAPFGLAMQPNHLAFGQLRNSGLNWLSKNVLMRDVRIYLDQVRSRLGLPQKGQDFFGAALSPFLYLQGTTPSFEYPRRDLPAQIHFIGLSLQLPSADFTPPTWWQDLQSETPVVHVTQGTIATQASNLIVPTLQALTNEAVLVVATTGGQAIEGLNLESVPANVRLEPFIPHAHLLPHVDVMVTNGGFNGVQMALANGVPLVTAGQTEEKPEICARVQWTGTGIDLKTNTPTPTQIRAAVQKVLASPDYKQNAQRFQEENRLYDSAARAATLLGTLAITKQPILRKSEVA